MAIPPKVRAALADDPFMSDCIVAQFLIDPTPCFGRVEWEHAFPSMSYAQEPWAIVGCCTGHHRIHLDKRFNRLISLCRATEAQLKANSKAEDLQQTLKGLMASYLQRLKVTKVLLIPKAPAV